MQPLRALVLSVVAVAAMPAFAQSGDAAGVTIDPGGVLRHRAPVPFPGKDAAAGTVELEATLARDGEVSDARVTSGPIALRRSALASVLEWHYAPETASPVHISIQFEADPVPNAQPGPLQVSPGTQAPEDFTAGRFAHIEFEGVATNAQQVLRGVLPLHEGDTMHQSDFARINNAVRSFDEHLVPTYTGRMAGPDIHRDVTIHIRPSIPGWAVATTLIQGLPVAKK